MREPLGRRSTPVHVEPVVRDDATEAFFAGTARGVFLLRRSVRSGEVLTPSAVQDSAGNTDMDWVEASGRGTVVSWAFVPQRVADSDVPRELTIGLIELDEGPWWWTQLIDVDRDDVAEGLRVRAVFTKSGPAETDEYVPVFTPAEPGTATSH